MTLRDINGERSWPGYAYTAGTSVGTNTTLDAAGEYDGFVMVAKEDMTISHVGWRSGVATGSPVVEVRIETVNTSDGLPSGTLWNRNGTGANPNVTSGTISSTTWNLHALTNAAIILKGEAFAVLLKYSSGTSVQVHGASRGLLHSSNVGLPYRVVNTGTPTASAIGAATSLVYALGSSSTTFYQIPQLIPISNTGSTTLSSTGTFRAACLRFQVPFKCRASGISFADSSYAITDDFSVGIYNDAGTELNNSLTAFDSSFRFNAVPWVYLDNKVELSPSTWYRAVVQADTTGGPGIYNFSIQSTDYAMAVPNGLYAQLGTRDSGGAWTDTATTIPNIDILIDQLDDGTSSGGGGSYWSIGG